MLLLQTIAGSLYLNPDSDSDFATILRLFQAKFPVRNSDCFIIAISYLYPSYFRVAKLLAASIAYRMTTGRFSAKLDKPPPQTDKSGDEEARMDANALKAASATWARLLAFALVLAALAVAAGAACGSDDGSGSGSSSGGVSIQNISTIPDSDYRWIGVLDVGELLAGDIPTIEEDESYIERRGSYTERLAAEFVNIELLGISVTDLETVVSLYPVYSDAHFLIQGNFSLDAVRDSLNKTASPLESSAEYEAWGFRGGGAAALVQQDLYWIDNNDEDFLEFFEPATRTTLPENANHPLTRALNKVGKGWLVAAWIGWIGGSDYCEVGFDDLDDEMSDCQATALAASNAGDETVDVKWVILFDTEESANSAASAIQELARTNELEMGWRVNEAGILDLKTGTDDEFVEIELSVTSEAAAEYLDFLISEMWTHH